MNLSGDKSSTHNKIEEVIIADKKDWSAIHIDNCTIQDFVLEDLDPQIKSQLDSLPVSWFHSLSNAARYSYPSAKRVFIQRSVGGHIIAAWYQRVHRTWLWKQVILNGPPSLSSSDLRSLLTLSNANVMTLTLLTEEQTTGLCYSQFGTLKERIGEDMVIDLPDDPDIYLRSLGQKTRKHLPYYFRRLEREFGGKLINITLSREQISYDLFSSLVSLSRSRLNNKGITSDWETDVMAYRLPLFQESGIFFGYGVEDRLVCGTLSVIHNREGYLILIGHDPRYDHLDAGLVCLWKTIEYMIGIGIDRFHLMWGRVPYKMQLGGKEHEMFEITVFRRRMIVYVWIMYLIRLSRREFIKIAKLIGLDKLRNKMVQLLTRMLCAKKEV